MLDAAINMTLRGFGDTVTDILVASPQTSKHLRNYIAMSMKDGKKDDATKLLNALEETAKQKATARVNFSECGEIDFSTAWAIDKTWLVARNFKIHPLMIIALLVAFIFSLLQIPNLGLRIGNLLRNKFHISRKAQVAVGEVFNFLSKIAKDVTSAFSSVLKYMAPVTPMVAVTPFQDTLLNISQDSRTRSAYQRIVNQLGPRDKQIIDSLTTGTKSRSFSQYQFAQMPFNPRLRGQTMMEQGEPSDVDEILTVARVITQMLAFPGVGQIVMIFASQFIPITMLTVLLGGALVGAGGALATKGIDSIQRLRDQMVAYNSL